MSQEALRLENVSLELNGTTILEGVNCSIPEGMITTVLGPSGAGKSSLLKSIVRLLPAKGRIFYRNNLVDSQDIRSYRREVIYVSQVPVVFPGTVADNIQWGRQLWSLPPTDVEVHLQMVGLEPAMKDQEATTLSVGQQQRLHLARSLALQPRILLLDEPASSLDAISKEAFEQLISGLLDKYPDLTIVMITHDLTQARRIAEHAILLDKGRLKLDDHASVFFDTLTDMTESEILQELIGREEADK